MKVISNTILFVYSLRCAIIEIVRVWHTRWGNFFHGTNPITEGLQLRSPITNVTQLANVHQAMNVYFPGHGSSKDRLRYSSDKSLSSG